MKKTTAIRISNEGGMIRAGYVYRPAYTKSNDLLIYRAKKEDAEHYDDSTGKYVVTLGCLIGREPLQDMWTCVWSSDDDDSTIKRATIDRILDAAQGGRSVIIGKYTYRANLNTGDVSRCLTCEVGQEWFDCEGNRCNGWQVVAHA